MQASRVISFGVSASYLVLCAIVARETLRQRDRQHQALLCALGCFAIVTVSQRIGDLTGNRYRPVAILTSIAFLAGGYALLLFRDTFIPLRPTTRRAALAGVLIVVGLFFIVRLPTEPEPQYSPVQWIVILAFIGVWAACVGEPIVRFWRSSRTVALVQRTRLRAIASAYAGTLVVLIATVTLGHARRVPDVSLGLSIAALMIVILLYGAFAPPRFVRRLWREPEEEVFRSGVETLIQYAADRRELAERVVEWAIRLVGAEAGVLIDANGEALASIGSFGDSVRFLPPTSEEPSIVGRGRTTVMVVPMRLKDGLAGIVVRGGPFTPIFGTDELHRLSQYARGVAVALDRLELVEQVGRQSDQYETLLKGLSDLGEGFVLLENGSVVYVNEAYERLSGYTLDELRPISLVDLTVPEDREVIADIGRRRQAGQTVPDHYETAMIAKGGRRVDVEVAIKTRIDGGIVQTFTLVRDITERKRSERELRQISEARRAFIANAAHELRTPVTVVSGAASMLVKHHDKLSRGKIDETYAALERQTERIQVLVENLLDLSQIDEGKLAVHLQPVALHHAAERALEGAPPPEGVHLEVAVAPDVMVLADPDRLDQVLVNFFTNAYRYGGHGLKLHARAGSDDVVLSIADDGPGVAAELIPHLFDPFTRGPDVRRVQGSGLGLAIVRKLVEAFGGEVWYEPVSPHGACFNIRLGRAA